MRYAECVRCSRTVGWIGLVTNTILMIMKGFVGLVAGSHALMADAMYSAKDVVTSVLVIVGISVSDRPLDREHPYGHGKVEFILSLAISLVFMAVTVYLFFAAVGTLLDDDVGRPPHLIALWAALLSIAVNVGMHFYSRCVAIEVNSPMVRTLAKHHHADATASVAVAAGIVGAHYLNMPWIDTAVAITETLHLMYLGSDVFRDAFSGLMDRNVDEKVREKMTGLAKSVDGVSEIKHLRTRRVGQELSTEITIGVDSDISVEEAYAITERVQDKIGQTVSHVGSLQVSFESFSTDAANIAEFSSRWTRDKTTIVETGEG